MHLRVVPPSCSHVSSPPHSRLEAGQLSAFKSAWRSKSLTVPVFTLPNALAHKLEPQTVLLAVPYYIRPPESEFRLPIPFSVDAAIFILFHPFVIAVLLGERWRREGG